VDEIAPTAVLLASDEGSYYIGASLNPNGGDYMI
jgi:3-oxoacyl-[acyl-carrier protein] reductase